MPPLVDAGLVRGAVVAGEDYQRVVGLIGFLQGVEHAPDHIVGLDKEFATDQDPYFDYIRPTVAHIRCDTTPWVRRITKWADHVEVGKEDRCQTLTQTIFVEGGTIGPPPGKRCAPSRRVIR